MRAPTEMVLGDHPGAWLDAPIPSRWHRCKPVVVARVNYFTLVERCACGAVRLNGRGWLERNSRRSLR